MSQEQVRDRVQSEQRGFEALLSRVTSAIAERPLDSALEAWLSRSLPPASDHAGIDADWICKYEAGGIRHGRVLKPRSELKGEALVLYLLPNGANEFTES